MTALLPLVAAVLLAAPVPKPAPKTTTDTDAIQGTWDLVSAEVEGKKAPKDAKGVTMVVTKDQLVIKEPGSPREEKANFTLDPKKKLKEIDIRPSAKEIVKGIYKLEKDSLVLCFHKKKNGMRPTAFDEKDATTLVFKRQKK